MLPKNLNESTASIQTYDLLKLLIVRRRRTDPMVGYRREGRHSMHVTYLRRTHLAWSDTDQARCVRRNKSTVCPHENSS
jgi:hypothetical protein